MNLQELRDIKLACDKVGARNVEICLNHKQFRALYTELVQSFSLIQDVEKMPPHMDVYGIRVNHNIPMREITL